MVLKVLILISLFVIFCNKNASCRSRKYSYARTRHTAGHLSDRQLTKLADMSDIDHFNSVLDKILVPRVVGTAEHDQVADYIVGEMKNLGWDVERHKFEDQTPIFGNLEFQNIVAKSNPQADRQLVLACHYDSKYTKEGVFLGATDSAVPCAMMINLAHVMRSMLAKAKNNNDVGLLFIFFDGEEAFENWSDTDSIYGAKNLASHWHNKKYRSQLDSDENVTELDRIDLLVLLDLLGAKSPTIYSYFSNTAKWFSLLSNIEDRLSEEDRSSNQNEKYFLPYHYPSHIEDDHIPFLRRGVPILHIIPSPFPSVWHKLSDDRSVVDIRTVEKLNKIFRAFVAQYMNLEI